MRASHLPTRRHTWRTIALIALAAALTAQCKDEPAKPTEPVAAATPAPEATGVIEARAPKPAKRKPWSCEDCNVVLISIDTLRADHLSTYGYERKTSPRIDAFAEKALVFENAISQSTWTTPSHASMMTGLLPSEHELVLYPKPGQLGDDLPTIAKILRAKGYRTLGFHGGGYAGSAFRLDRGFEVYESKSRGFLKNFWAAKKWLEAHDQERFFLFLHGFDVHKPYDKYDYNTFHEPKGEYDMQSYCRGKHRVREGDELAYLIAQYDAGIVYADKLVGGFLDFLKKRKLLDRTIVIITSDHGDEFFEHGDCDHKHTVYRELVHVPLIVRSPGVPAGRVAHQVAASISLMPTVMGLLGLESPVGSEHDLRRVARKKGEQRFVISETGHWRGINSRLSNEIPKEVGYYKRGVTTAAHKLIYDWRLGEERWELYDVQKDLGEQHDLAATQPAVADALKPHLFRDGKPVVPRGNETAAAAIDPETEAELRALGYVE